MEAVYTRGDVVDLHCDLYPAFVNPTPPGVPENITKLRVVVTERCLTVGWSIAGVVYRQDIPMTVEQTANVTLRGGTVGPYEIGKASGCSTCGNGAIKNWKPWPGIVYRDAFRTQQAAAELKKDKNYGLPSARYTRSR